MSILSSIREKISKYADVYIRLFKLDLIGHTASLMSYFIFLLISLFIFFCMLLFIGFGFVEAFNAIGLPRMASFFITVIFYFLLLLLIIMRRQKITRYFSGKIIQVLTENDDDKDKSQ